jgi:FkbM family methyltransferase
VAPRRARWWRASGAVNGGIVTDETQHPASGTRYGRPSRFERLGGWIGRLIGEGTIRQVLRAAFRSMLGVLGRRQLRSVLPGGEVVRLAPAFRHMTWNPVEYAAFRAVLRVGDTALDVGANVGAYAVLFGMWIGETGRVFAFEPAAAAFAGLEAHVALNGLGQRVRAVRAAVSDHVGTARFVSEGAQGTNHLLTPGTSAPGGATIEVPTTTIDAFCVEHGLRPRLIKIDVEGAECAVLRGARRTIAAMPEGGAVFVELHPTAWAEMGMTAGDVGAELAAQGLRAVPLRPGVSPWTVEGECVRLERV